MTSSLDPSEYTTYFCCLKSHYAFISNDAYGDNTVSVASRTLISIFFQYLVDHSNTLASLDSTGNQATNYKRQPIFNYGVNLENCHDCKFKPAYLKRVVVTNDIPLNLLLFRAWTINAINSVPTTRLLSVSLDTGALTPLTNVLNQNYVAGDFINGIFYVANETNRKLEKIDENGTITTIGDLPNRQLFIIAISLQHDVKNNVTYYIDYTAFDNSEYLYKVDLTTGTFSNPRQITNTNFNYIITLVIDGNGKAYTMTEVFDRLNEFDLDTATVVGTGFPIVDINDAPIDIRFVPQESDFSCGIDGKLYCILRTVSNLTLFGTLEIQSTKAVFTEIKNYPTGYTPFAVDC